MPLVKISKLKSITISKSTFLKILIGFSLVAASFFGYLYWKKTNILDVVNEIPLVKYTKPPRYIMDIYGNEKMPFKFPLAVSASNGEVFVSDSDLGAIQVFDYNGNFLRIIGNKDERGKLKNPYGIKIYQNTLYVADGGSGKILMYNRMGEYQGSIQPTDKSLMRTPAGLEIKNDLIYYTDLSLGTVNVMGMNGEVLTVFGGRGDAEGQFNYPHDILIDKEDNIYVADSGNNRVQVFNEKGEFQRVVGGEVGTPRGIDIDNKGNLYIVSGMENRVYVFNEKDELLFDFSEVSNKDSLSLPNGISIDGFGNVFVTETGMKKVAMFEYNVIEF